MLTKIKAKKVLIGMDLGDAAIYRLNIQPYQQINQLVESQLKWQKQQ
jgi:hypothetical protein